MFDEFKMVEKHHRTSRTESGHREPLTPAGARLRALESLGLALPVAGADLARFWSETGADEDIDA